MNLILKISGAMLVVEQCVKTINCKELVASTAQETLLVWNVYSQAGRIHRLVSMGLHLPLVHWIGSSVVVTARPSTAWSQPTPVTA